MELLSLNNDPIEAISCERIKEVVVETNAGGEQIVSPRSPSLHLSQKDMLAAPEGCPITVDPTLRRLSNFTICVTDCPYSYIAMPKN